MVDQVIRPEALPRRDNPVASEIVPVDNGVEVAGATIQSIVEAGRPVASRPEAEAGVDSVKAMTPLTTAQKIQYEIDRSIASKAQGDLANSAIQPADLAVVATTGSYNDLSDKPVIPPALADGNKGDITVSSSGANWKINPGSVGYPEISSVVSTDISSGLTSISLANAASIYDITDPRIVVATNRQDGGVYVRQSGAIPKGAIAPNFLPSSVPGSYWEVSGKITSPTPGSYIAAFFRSDTDTSVDVFTSQDGQNFRRANSSPLISDPGGTTLSGRDPGLFFFNGWWFIAITDFGTDAGGIWDLVVYRSRNLSNWERVKVRLGSGVYNTTASSVGGSVPSDTIWAPKLFTDGISLYVAVSVRFAANVGSDKFFRTFVSFCSDTENLTFFAPARIMIGPDTLNTIDANFYLREGRYTVAVKNEGTKNIEIWRSSDTDIQGSYTIQSTVPFSSPVEAPCLTFIDRYGGRFIRLYADAYYSGFYRFKDSFDGGNTWGGEQSISTEAGVRHGTVLNLNDTTNPSLAIKNMHDYVALSGDPKYTGFTRTVSLPNGTATGGGPFRTDWSPDDDVLYFVGAANVCNIPIGYVTARRFYLACLSGNPTAGINLVQGTLFPAANVKIGFGTSSDKIFEVRLLNGAYYIMAG